jgi:hypothetical protein
MSIIQIDATRLYYPEFQIPGFTNFLDSRMLQTIPLAPGSYDFQVAAGSIAFQFQVTDDCTLDYSPDFDTFLQGRGTSQLIVNGLEVTIDARYLSGIGVIVDGNASPFPPPSLQFLQYGTIRLLPSIAIQVLQGSALVASFTYGLDVNGKFFYDSAYDLSNGGFLEGQNTSTLVFYGYPIVIDTRAAGTSLLLLGDIPSCQVNSVLLVNLLPANGIHLNTDTLGITRSSFGVALDGKLLVEPSSVASFVVGLFKGIPRIEATALLQ